jgi:uncharacterized protein
MKWIWPLVRTSMRHPAAVIGFAAMVTLVCAVIVAQTKVDTDLANLLPEGNPHVETLFRLTDIMGAEDNFQVIITGDDASKLVEVGEAFAMRLRGESVEGVALVNHVEFRNETGVLRDNFLYFLRDDEIADVIRRIKDEIENAKLEANPFFVELDEDAAMTDVDLPDFQLPPEYVFSVDSSAVMLTVYPNGSKSDISYIDTLFERVDDVISETLGGFEGDGIEIFYGGAFSEYITKFNDLRGTLNFAVVFGIVAILVFLMVYISFLSGRYVFIGGIGGRTWVARLVFIFKNMGGIILSLVISLVVTFAVAYLLFGELNIMTTVLIAILLGVNIDYVLHFNSVYLRERSVHSHARAVKNTLWGCGQALLISCLTTGLAMLVLLISEFRGFFEFGVIFFVGIISIYLVTCTLFVSLLTVLKLKPVGRGTLNYSDDSTSIRSGYHFSGIATFALILVVFISLPGIFQTQFEYNFGDLEPKSDNFSEFNQLKDSFDTQRKSDPAYFLLDYSEDASTVAMMIRNPGDGKFETVGNVESFAERFPNSDAAIEARLSDISAIRRLLADTFLANRGDSIIVQLRKAASQTQPMTLDQVPDFFKNRFLDRDGNSTGIVMINPNMMLSDGRNSIRFKQDAGQVTLGESTYYAASTSIIAASILEIITEESNYLIFLPLLITLVCLVLFFRSIFWGILTFAPLFCALIILAGIMGYVGLKFNLYNLIVLPAILGVGADNAIHLFHRLRDDNRVGFGKVPLQDDNRFGFGEIGLRDDNRVTFGEIIGSTGLFITASSITTILGFVGLIFTNHPGLQSMGIVASAGILLTLLTSTIFASAYHYHIKKPRTD